MAKKQANPRSIENKPEQPTTHLSIRPNAAKKIIDEFENLKEAEIHARPSQDNSFNDLDALRAKVSAFRKMLTTYERFPLLLKSLESEIKKMKRRGE